MTAHEMETFMNNLIDDDKSESEDIKLTQAKLDEFHEQSN
jgi:hypothetical protein